MWEMDWILSRASGGLAIGKVFHVASHWQKCGLYIRIIEVLEFLKSKDKFLE